jgi:predicted TIM-barrel fold metal-dependent hydrolase
MSLFDAGAWLGPWPFQRFAEDGAEKLARKLQAEGIARALVSPADAVFLPDPQDANAAFLRILGAYPFFYPVPVINPAMRNARELIGRYAAEGARAVRILPAYHGVSADAPCVLEAVEEAGRRNLLPLVQARIEDERAQHPLCKIPGIDVGAAASLCRAYPALPVLVPCLYFAEAVRLLREAPNAHVDIAFVERFRTIPSFLKEAPADRVLFATHAPFLYVRAAVMKTQDPGIAPADLAAIGSGTVERLLERRAH